MNKIDAIKTAMIGCGAIAERGHLAAATDCRSIAVTAFVDRDIHRAEQLAAKIGTGVVLDDASDVPDHADAAIVALPPALHAPVAIDLMERGIHVLVEKPMALSAAECDAMIEAATRKNVTLAVGLVRRFRWAYRYAKQFIDAGMLGRIESFEVSEGGIFDWPVATPFFLTKEGAGGGVLADAGAHALDALLWWFGDVESITYHDDDFGGVEANCKLQLVMKNGVHGRVELSRTRQMPNTTVLHGELGSLTLSAFNNDITIKLDGDSRDRSFTLIGSLEQNILNNEQASHENVMADQLSDFADAIRNDRAPTVTGQEARRSVALVEACYAQRQPLNHPWTFEGIVQAKRATDQSDHQTAMPPRQAPATVAGGEV